MLLPDLFAIIKDETTWNTGGAKSHQQYMQFAKKNKWRLNKYEGPNKYSNNHTFCSPEYAIADRVPICVLTHVFYHKCFLLWQTLHILILEKTKVSHIYRCLYTAKNILTTLPLPFTIVLFSISIIIMKSRRIWRFYTFIRIKICKCNTNVCLLVLFT